MANQKIIYPDQVVRCLDSTKSRYRYCLGYCTNQRHSGYITSRILEEHDCLNKGCLFFKPIKSNSFWYRKEMDEEAKKKIKRIRKEHKHYERKIMDRAPKNSNPVLSKHLYDDTYLLAIEGDYINNKEEIFGDMDINLYIKKISQEEINNYDVTFLKSLPEEMRDKYKKEQEKIKKDQIKRRG